MKHLRLWESHKTEVEVAEICKQLGIQNWSINSQGLVDVDGSVYSGKGFEQKLPLDFGTVLGSFYCHYNQLTTLEGSPKFVGESFNCSANKLTNLKGSPQVIPEQFYCQGNKLTSLEGGPRKVGSAFYCNKNMLTSLEGAPESVGGSFYCQDNKLTSLVGAPELIGGDFVCDTYLTSYEGLPKSINGSGSDAWILNNIHRIEVSTFQTIPDYALTPKLLAFIRKNYPDQYNILKQRRDEDQRWKTDLSAEMGNLGFD